MLTTYFAARRFRSPFLRSIQGVGPLCALWALLCGPIYYWRKQAPIEALVFASALALLLLFDEDWDGASLANSVDLGTVIWLSFALLAPLLLPACYLRKGWVEVTKTGF